MPVPTVPYNVSLTMLYCATNNITRLYHINLTIPEPTSSRRTIPYIAKPCYIFLARPNRNALHQNTLRLTLPYNPHITEQNTTLPKSASSHNTRPNIPYQTKPDHARHDRTSPGRIFLTRPSPTMPNNTKPHQASPSRIFLT